MKKTKQPEIPDAIPQLTLFAIEPGDSLPEPAMKPAMAANTAATKQTTAAAKTKPAAKAVVRAQRNQTPPPTPQRTRTSSAVPAGDVRLTANIREDLHLKLKIAAARQRTTIGELIEQWVESSL